MSRRIQTAFPHPASRTIFCMGDSLTDNEGAKGVMGHLMWPGMLQTRLNGLQDSNGNTLGVSVQARNLGRSGERSNSMITRTTELLMFETPNIAMMWTGTNDTPVPTWAGTGGSITATSGQFIGVVLVYHVSTGIDMVSQPVAAATTTTSTGSIALPAINTLYESSFDIYTTTTTFSTALAAITAGPALYRLSASSSGLNATTATALGSTTVLNTVQGVSAFTTQQCLQAFSRAVKYLCRGAAPYVMPTTGVAVKDQTQLPAGNYFGSRFVVMNDTSTTGGQANTQGGQHATISGTQAGMTVWEWRYSYTGETGWGRVAIGSTPVFNSATKIFIPGHHYLNYSSAGDTTGTPLQQFDDVSGIRSQQKAAVVAEAALEAAMATGVLTQYIDIYTFLKARIGTAPDTQGSFSWHVADLDPHRNAYGEDLIAQAILGNVSTSGTILGTSGLLAALIP